MFLHAEIANNSRIMRSHNIYFCIIWLEMFGSGRRVCVCNGEKQHSSLKNQLAGIEYAIVATERERERMFNVNHNWCAHCSLLSVQCKDSGVGRIFNIRKFLVCKTVLTYSAGT